MEKELFHLVEKGTSAVMAVREAARQLQEAGFEELSFQRGRLQLRGLQLSHIPALSPVIVVSPVLSVLGVPGMGQSDRFPFPICSSISFINFCLFICGI